MGCGLGAQLDIIQLSRVDDDSGFAPALLLLIRSQSRSHKAYEQQQLYPLSLPKHADLSP